MTGRGLGKVGSVSALSTKSKVTSAARTALWPACRVALCRLHRAQPRRLLGAWVPQAHRPEPLLPRGATAGRALRARTPATLKVTPGAVEAWPAHFVNVNL